MNCTYCGKPINTDWTPSKAERTQRAIQEGKERSHYYPSIGQEVHRSCLVASWYTRPKTTN